MRSKNIFLIAIVALIGCFSCQKLLIKPDPTSDAQKNFEIFWNDLNNGYPYFVEDNIDWKARYDTYNALVNSSTSTDRLYTYFTEMLKGFSDGHLSVTYKDSSYSNEKTIPELIQLVRADNTGTLLYLDQNNVDCLNNYFNYNQNSPAGYYLNINEGYLQDPLTVTGGDGINPNSQQNICIYGLIQNQFTSKNILYVNIATFETDYSIENLLQRIFIDEFPNSDGMIVDLRMNGGGNLGIMRDAMSVFMPLGSNEVRYAYNREKVGPLPENFGPEKYFVVLEKNNQRYLKPIVVLTNRLTVSAAEHATMAMREISKVRPNHDIKIIGDYTFGATSFIVQRTLPCGIDYTLVNSKTWDINHVIVEKTGVKPDEQVFLTVNSVTSGQDEQMERAIQVLSGN